MILSQMSFFNANNLHQGFLTIGLPSFLCSIDLVTNHVLIPHLTSTFGPAKAAIGQPFISFKPDIEL